MPVTKQLPHAVLKSENRLRKMGLGVVNPDSIKQYVLEIKEEYIWTYTEKTSIDISKLSRDEKINTFNKLYLPETQNNIRFNKEFIEDSNRILFEIGYWKLTEVKE